MNFQTKEGLLEAEKVLQATFGSQYAYLLDLSLFLNPLRALPCKSRKNQTMVEECVLNTERATLVALNAWFLLNVESSFILNFLRASFALAIDRRGEGFLTSMDRLFLEQLPERNDRELRSLHDRIFPVSQPHESFLPDLKSKVTDKQSYKSAGSIRWWVIDRTPEFAEALAAFPFYRDNTQAKIIEHESAMLEQLIFAELHRINLHQSENSYYYFHKYLYRAYDHAVQGLQLMGAAEKKESSLPAALAPLMSGRDIWQSRLESVVVPMPTIEGIELMRTIFFENLKGDRPASLNAALRLVDQFVEGSPHRVELEKSLYGNLDMMAGKDGLMFSTRGEARVYGNFRDVFSVLGFFVVSRSLYSRSLFHVKETLRNRLLKELFQPDRGW